MYSKSTVILVLLLWAGPGVARPLGPPDLKININISDTDKKELGVSCPSDEMQTTMGYPSPPVVETPPPIPTESVNTPPEIPSELETYASAYESAMETPEMPMPSDNICPDETEMLQPTEPTPVTPTTTGSSTLNIPGSLSTASEDVSFPADEPEPTIGDPDASPMPTDVDPSPTASAGTGDEETPTPSQSAMVSEGGQVPEEPMETGGAEETDEPEEQTPQPQPSVTTDGRFMTPTISKEIPSAASMTVPASITSAAAGIEEECPKESGADDADPISSEGEPATSTYIEAAWRRPQDPADVIVYSSTDEVKVPMKTPSAIDMAIPSSTMIPDLGGDELPAMPSARTMPPSFPSSSIGSGVINSSGSGSDWNVNIPADTSNRNPVTRAGSSTSNVHIKISPNPEEPPKSSMEVQDDGHSGTSNDDSGKKNNSEMDSGPTGRGKVVGGFHHDESWYGWRNEELGVSSGIREREGMQ